MSTFDDVGLSDFAPNTTLELATLLSIFVKELHPKTFLGIVSSTKNDIFLEKRKIRAVLQCQ